MPPPLLPHDVSSGRSPPHARRRVWGGGPAHGACGVGRWACAGAAGAGAAAGAAGAGALALATMTTMNSSRRRCARPRPGHVCRAPRGAVATPSTLNSTTQTQMCCSCLQSAEVRVAAKSKMASSPPNSDASTTAWAAGAYRAGRQLKRRKAALTAVPSRRREVRPLLYAMTAASRRSAPTQSPLRPAAPGASRKKARGLRAAGRLNARTPAGPCDRIAPGPMFDMVLCATARRQQPASWKPDADHRPPHCGRMAAKARQRAPGPAWQEARKRLT